MLKIETNKLPSLPVSSEPQQQVNIAKTMHKIMMAPDFITEKFSGMSANSYNSKIELKSFTK